MNLILHKSQAQKRSRIASALRSTRGAIDLASIMVGVLVLGIIGGVITTSVFAVIPWAQNEATKQTLGAINLAESTAQVKEIPHSFYNLADLVAKNYLPAPGGAAPHLTASTGLSGQCYVGAAKSSTGAIYFTTSKDPEVQLYTAASNTDWCLDLSALVAGLGSSDGASGSGGTITDPSLVAWDIPDTRLRADVVAALNLAPGTALTLADAPNLYILDVADDGSGAAIPLDGLEHATNLAALSIGGALPDFTPIALLPSIIDLHIYGGSVTDISAVSGLSLIQGLDLSRSSVSDIGPTTGLTSLVYLNLYQTQVSDLSPLAGLSALTNLNAMWTQVSDLSPLAGLSALKSVNVGWTQVSDLSPLAGLSLTNLYLSGDSSISDISPLASMAGLSLLEIYGTSVSDLSPIAGMGDLWYLSFARTAVTDLSPLASLGTLSYLSLSWTDGTDLSPLFGSTNLTSLTLYNGDLSAPQVAALQAAVPGVTVTAF